MIYRSLTLINCYGTIYLIKYLISFELKFILIVICNNKACIITK